MRKERERLPEHKLEVLYNFVKKIPIINHVQAEEKPFTFGVACRLIKLKNIEESMQIIKYLNDSGINCKFKIAGDGPEKSYLISKAKELDILDKLEFLGHLEDLDEFYNSLDCYLISSFTEDLPISMLEALSFGKLILSRDVGGIPEILQRCDALIYKSFNSDKSQIYEFVKRNETNIFSEKNKNLAKKIFSSESYFKQLKSIYNVLN